MRTFILLCFVALAAADQLPYNYAPVSHGSDILSGPIVEATQPAPSFAPVDSGYDKEFYTFNANDGDFHDPQASEQIGNSLKKNLQVVFIKGPENHAIEDAAVHLAKHASEQRTAIYVLNRQADINGLADRFNQENNHNRQRPEVHFVKYRTPQDAQHAQHAIQSQYDQLGGASTNHNGGVVPVLDFASKSQHIGGGGNVAIDDFSPAGSAPSGHYLPANFLRFRR